MTATTTDQAFRDLERALTRRRVRGLDPVLRLEIAVIAGLIALFCGWQLRPPLDGIARAAGPYGAARALALRLLAVIAAAATVAGARYARRLRSPTGPVAPEPAWLALPIPPAALERHLAWEARTIVPWALVPALGAWVAALGLVPAWLLVLIAAAFAALLVPASRAGCAAAFHLATRATPAPAGPAAALHPIERALAAAPSEARVGRVREARWRRTPAWRALWLKDLTISTRPTPAQARARSMLVVMALAALVWRLPIDADLARLASFALALVAAAALAEWLIELAGADPAPLLGLLPIGVGPVWTARVAWALAGAAALVAFEALAAPALMPAARGVYLVWTGAAALAIGVLGAQLGLSLHPHAGQARRVLGLTLLVAVAASLMMPLMGWGLLLAALVHSALRLPRGPAGEAVA